ncbi:Gfo/Idh/MocA family oxidoreductase [Candidatus Poribacteria bacterium]|nr:Gfo/Idh/MocA family oxidoreductase [Candidatus Poribacteria bacterium]
MRGIIVGVGGRARSWYDTCRRHRDVELVGYVEISPERRERVISEWGLPRDEVHDSLSNALKAAEADFVCDVTPPAAHERVALEAFDAGLHVIGEKPLSDTFEAAYRMVAAAERAGVTHVITQNYRFGRTPRTAHRLLKEGVVGGPEHAVVGFYMPWAKAPGTHYVTMPYPLITDMGIHHFDMLRYVLDREPVNVLAKTWNVSWGWHAGDAAHTAIFEFEGGLTVTHHSLGASVGKRTSWNGDWRIEGPKGSLTWEDDALFWTGNPAGPKDGREQLPLDELPLGGQDALLEEFVSAIREGREPECSSRDNIKSLAMVFAGIKSDKEKRQVDIAELFES